MSSQVTQAVPPFVGSSDTGQFPSLIEMFSPRSLHPGLVARQPGDVDQSLWHADTAHRAKNFAQMFNSLGYLAARLPGQHDSDEIVSRAAALAVAYAELGQSGDAYAAVPCARLLRQVVAGLVALFEPRPGAIALTFASDQLSLNHERRRALVLVASELIINALKYAFPAGAGGKIGLALSTSENWVELIVEDNGVGLTGLEAVGHGGPLIDALCGKLDATLNRASPKRGLRVSVTFPVAAFRFGLA